MRTARQRCTGWQWSTLRTQRGCCWRREPAVDARDNSGWTPLHVAVEQWWSDLTRMEYISSRMPSPVAPEERWWSKPTGLESMRVLLEAGASRSEVPEDLRGRLPE